MAEYDENNLIEDRVEILIRLWALKGKIVIDRETEQDEVIEK